MAKLPVILGNLDVTIDNVAPDLISKLFKFAACSQDERYTELVLIPDQTVCSLFISPFCFCI